MQELLDEKKQEATIPTTGSIYIFGTFDTKGAEISYLSKLISNKLCKWSEPSLSKTCIQLIDISSSKCVTYSPLDISDISTDEKDIDNKQFYADYTCRDIVPNFDKICKLDRSKSIAAVTEAAQKFIIEEYQKGTIVGVISLGGTCGTSMTAALFSNNLPLGLPKIIISTVASSRMAGEIIGSSDLILMPSIIDISGVNDIYKIIAENASSAIVAMSMNYSMNKIESKYKSKNGDNKFIIGITMFGITTPCVEFVKEKLYNKYGKDNIDILIFHATGTGGKCMECLVENKLINGVIDITTTEVADYICGGILSCDKLRFDAAHNNNIPTIISLGAVNVANFGTKTSISKDLLTDKEHVLHVHNSQVTLMKANENELKDIVKFIGNKVNKYNSNNICMIIPNNGVSALDNKDSKSTFKPFGENDLKILKGTLENEIKNKDILKYIDAHINDEKFADGVVNEFDNIMKRMKINIGIGVMKETEVKRRDKIMNVENYKMGGRRKDIISLFYDKINKGEPIIGAGAGTGISAKCEVMGGADLIIIYNSGKYRMAGRGSLAGLLSFGDANIIVQEMASQVIPIVKQLRGGIVPVLAGINGTDPFKDMNLLLNTIKSMGFDGVQNFPTVGLIDGKFRTNLEETGFGYDKEVLCMKIAKDKYNLITTPYVFNVNDCIKMTQIGVDIIVIHLGLTVGGTIGSKTTGMTLKDACKKIEIMANTIYSINPNQIILAHGGPVATPNDVKFVLNNLPNGTIDGFYGASSMERLPVEVAITNTIKQFKHLKLYT